jgi:hypothetical protein
LAGSLFKEEGYQPEISLAKEIAKVECEGHPIVKFVWPKSNVSPKQSAKGCEG